MNMTTTVEITEDTHSRLKKARDIIHEKYKIQMRMPDLMEHYVGSPDEITKKVKESINNADKFLNIKGDENK